MSDNLTAAEAREIIRANGNEASLQRVVDEAPLLRPGHPVLPLLADSPAARRRRSSTSNAE